MRLPRLALAFAPLVAAAIACGTVISNDPDESDAATSAPDASEETAACTATCEKKCGSIALCGVTVQCGACGLNEECTSGTCICKSSTTCASAGAGCGEVVDECGRSSECGGCEAGTSCQASDGGLSCKAGECDAGNACAGRCGKITDACGKVVMCPATCANNQLCGFNKSPTTCGCNPRPFTLMQYNYSGYVCNQTEGAGACPGAFQGNVAKVYGLPAPGLTPLQRCVKVVGQTPFYHLAVGNACAAGYVLEGTIGFCSTTQVCGAADLHLYVHKTVPNNLVASFVNPALLAQFYDAGHICWAWPN